MFLRGFGNSVKRERSRKTNKYHGNFDVGSAEFFKTSARQTGRDIALQNDIEIATMHKIFTENLNKDGICAR